MSRREDMTSMLLSPILPCAPLSHYTRLVTHETCSILSYLLTTRRTRLPHRTRLYQLALSPALGYRMVAEVQQL